METLSRMTTVPTATRLGPRAKEIAPACAFGKGTLPAPRRSRWRTIWSKERQLSNRELDQGCYPRAQRSKRREFARLYCLAGRSVCSTDPSKSDKARTLVNDDGRVTIRLVGYDVPITTRGEHRSLVAKKKPEPGRRKPRFDVRN